jgi:glycosyltransferase involved in cell wall biosynthesis
MYLHHRVLKPYEKVDVFISPSRFLKQKTEEMGFKGKVVHLPNFINPSDYEPCFDSRNGTIVYFGRLSREKGLRTLIDAVKGLDISLKVIGTGPEKQNLEAKVVAERIANVSFLGYKTGRELHREIANSGFAVVPSEWYENNPRAIIEAFALGKPVLGANIGGIPELVRSGETGLTFESGNANDLRERILHLMKDKSALSRMGRAARCFVEKELNPRSHYERLMQIYKMAGA